MDKVNSLKILITCFEYPINVQLRNVQSFLDLSQILKDIFEDIFPMKNRYFDNSRFLKFLNQIRYPHQIST